MDQAIRCFNQLWSEIILKDVTPRGTNACIRKRCSEYYRVPPGFEIPGNSHPAEITEAGRHRAGILNNPDAIYKTLLRDNAR